jgi:ABC-2 type transport system permease protein
MNSVFGNEVVKTFRKWRSWIAFAAIGVVVPLVHLALWIQGDAMVRSLTRGIARDFLVLGNLMNGYFVTYFLMNSLWIHVPFLVTLGAGDQLAGEATGGTFRLLLIRPVSRTAILLAKYSTTLLYTLLLVLFLALLSVGVGILLFGTGDLIILGRTVTILPEALIPWRLCLAFAGAILGMWTVASLAFLFSSLVENAIGPIVGTMAVLIVMYVISNMPVDLFQGIRPYLFTTYLDLWQRVMREPVPWKDVGTAVAILFSYSVCFFLCSWYIFVKKDILS